MTNRPIRFPRSVIEEATKSNGTVDLNKIRAIQNKQLENRKQTAKRALQTRHENELVFDIFLSEFKKYFDIEFVPFKQNRIVSYKDAHGKLVRKRFKTDYVRFIEFYSEIKKKYAPLRSVIIDYFHYAFNKSVNEFQFNKQTKIFGVVVSQEIADEFFMERVRKRLREDNKRKRLEQRERHAYLFRRKSQ